jgi:serine/threonine protein kinase/Tfp pilus assembly protein PilF
MQPDSRDSDPRTLASVLALGLGTDVNPYSRVTDSSAGAQVTADQTPHIPGYDVIDQVGEGGMGAVWRAVQVRTNRQVALKLMSPGRFGSSRLRQRFEREIELAARLAHPHIARVYDSGSADGTWFYVMELIEGQHLDRYVAANKLSRRQILALMRQICLAIAYAHQRGVIHRDLKPSNILITSGGEPHIVDFGLAKALESETSNDSTLTQEGQYAGTPSFMSPEQAAGDFDRIDTRSDVYGLGATLYLLLTGHTPHDQSGPRYEVLRRIAADEIRPPRRMNVTLDSELESMLLRALAHDPEQRYESSVEFAADIERFLNGEALRASPPSRMYRLRKFVRRHRVGIAITAAFAVLLLGEASVSTWQAIRLAREKHRADEQAAIANAVSKFLNDDVLAQASTYAQNDPSHSPQRELTVRTALDRAAAGIGGQFTDQPLVQAAVRKAIGDAYVGLGQFQQADEQLQTALKLQESTVGRHDPQTLKTISSLGSLYIAQDKLPQAETQFHEAMESFRSQFGDNNDQTLQAMNDLGVIWLEQGRSTEALPLLQNALARARHALGNTHSTTMALMDSLARAYHDRDNDDDAEPLFKESLELTRKVKGPLHPDTLVSLNNLAQTYSEAGEYAKAEPLLVEALDGWRKSCGEEHPQTLAVMGNLGTLYMSSGEFTEAQPLLVRTLELRRRVLGDRSPETLYAMNELCRLYVRTNRLDEAVAIEREAFAAARDVLGPAHPRTLTMELNLGRALSSANRDAEAEPLFSDLYRNGPLSQADAKSVALMMSSYGPCLVKLHKYSQALPPLHEAASHLQAEKLETTPYYRAVVQALIAACDATANPTEAQRWRAKLGMLPANSPSSAPTTGRH